MKQEFYNELVEAKKLLWNASAKLKEVDKKLSFYRLNNVDGLEKTFGTIAHNTVSDIETIITELEKAEDLVLSNSHAWYISGAEAIN